MNIFPYRSARLATVALLLPAAQTFGRGLPGQGASPTTIWQDLQDVGVGVSLGGQEVKRQIATELGIAEAEVPLALNLPIVLAKQVCSQEMFEARANADRSCTAIRHVPEIAAAARDHPQTSAGPEQ